MITRHRRSKLLSRPYYPSNQKLARDINLLRAIRQKLAREQQVKPPVTATRKERAMSRSELWATVYAANISMMPEGAADAALKAFDERFQASVQTDGQAFKEWFDTFCDPGKATGGLVDQACLCGAKAAWFAALEYARK